MRRVLAVAVAVSALLAASAIPAAAAFATVDPGLRQRDLAVAPSGTFVLGAVLLPDGSWVVSEDQPPGGDGRLHRVQPGGSLSSGNAIGRRLDVASLILRRGQLYGLSLDSDSTSGNSPLYRIDPQTGEATTVTMWPKGTPELTVDPISQDLVLQNGGATGPIVRFNPDTGTMTTLVATAPSLDVEGLAFDPSGQTLYVGNSQDNRVSTGATGGVDGVYAYDRHGTLLYSFATRGSPDGFAIGPPGSCLAGQLIFSTDPVINQQQQPGEVLAVANPSSTAGLTPRTLATTAGPPGSNLMYVTTDAAGYPVVSHSNQLTRLECPPPPPRPPTPPPPTPPPPSPAPPPPAAHPQPPVHQFVGSAPAASSGSHAAVPVAPPAPGAPGTATAPAVQAQVQAQTIIAGQAATQAAPAAGLVDVPDEQPSVAFSARALDLQQTPIWIRLTLGALAVTAMAGAAVAMTGQRRIALARHEERPR